jgi:hypothetical protein
MLAECRLGKGVGFCAVFLGFVQNIEIDREVNLVFRI